MQANTKITLSSQEQQLVNNSNWILTKRAIIEKAVLLLAGSSERMKTILDGEKEWLPEMVQCSSPKISKGENYLMLPYVILDYPRCFTGGDVFAVRTMFWWGNFFSCTLHLAGIYKKMFEKDLLKNLSRPAQNDYYICVNGDPWQHHFGQDNYTRVDSVTPGRIEDVLQAQNFIKIALKFPLEQWDVMPSLLESKYAELIRLVKN